MPYKIEASRNIINSNFFVQLMEAAEAKASYGIVSNWKPLQKIIESLMENEVLTGEQVHEILAENGALHYPDPFVEGFGYAADNAIIYPGSKAVSLLNLFGPGMPVSKSPFSYRTCLENVLMCFFESRFEAWLSEVGSLMALWLLITLAQTKKVPFRLL